MYREETRGVLIGTRDTETKRDLTKEKYLTFEGFHLETD